MKRTIESLRVERLYRNAIDTFLAGRMPNFTHERHVHIANVLHHLPYGRELMHLGLHLQTMAHRHGIPEKYRPHITDMWWDRLDGALPNPALFADLPGGARGAEKSDRAARPEADCGRAQRNQAISAATFPVGAWCLSLG